MKEKFEKRTQVKRKTEIKNMKGDKWMEGRMDGEIDGWMGGWIDGSMDEIGCVIGWSD